MRFLAVAAALAASLALPERRPGQPGPADPRPGGTGYRVAGTDAAACFGTREQRRGDAGDDGHQPRTRSPPSPPCRRCSTAGRAARPAPPGQSVAMPAARGHNSPANGPPARRAAAAGAFRAGFHWTMSRVAATLGQREWKSARARRREGRNDVAGENLIARGRYRVVHFASRVQTFLRVSRELTTGHQRISPILSWLHFQLAPACSLIHDWLRVRIRPRGHGDGPVGRDAAGTPEVCRNAGPRGVVFAC